MSLQPQRPWQILTHDPSYLLHTSLDHVSFHLILHFSPLSNTESSPWSLTVSVASFITLVSPTAQSSLVLMCVWVCHSDSENVCVHFCEYLLDFFFATESVWVCELSTCVSFVRLYLWLSSRLWVCKYLALMWMWAGSQWLDKGPDVIFKKLYLAWVRHVSRTE